ncbi:MAG: hypothetical protein H8K11_01545 [Nitrospira sp.]|nr:hypothetical protein [Nitrospira sp.]
MSDYREDWKTHAEASYRWQLERAAGEIPAIHVPTPDDPAFRAEAVYLYDQNPALFTAAMSRIKRYGLAGGLLPNPSIRVPSNLQFLLGFCGMLEGPMDGTGGFVLKENEVMFSFDLSSPLHQQVKMVHRLLKHMQVHRFGKELFRRPKKDAWPLYLRTLDARDQGVTYEKIGKVLLGEHLESSNDQAAPRGKQFHDEAIYLALNFPPDDLDQYFPYPTLAPVS